MKKISKLTLLLICLIVCAGSFRYFSVINAFADFTDLKSGLSSALSSAECMVTMETNSKRVLYGHNMHKKRPMASVTKILTAITVIENCPDLNAKITVPAQAEGVEGSSIYLQTGEKISMLDLLYGLMLRSGNDCATALALSISGSIEDFAVLMNKTAFNAGAKDSNFVNPHGLHHDNHYTTAYDLAMITAYAMKNPVFKEIVSAKSKKIERTRENGMELLINKNKLLNSFEGADGVKTGFTKKAGRCFVASATRSGMQVISVVLNCGPMFEDCARLMESAFNEFKPTCIGAAGEVVTQAPIVNGKCDNVKAGLKDNLFYPLKTGESLNKQYIFDSGLKAPIKKDTCIGKIVYSLNGKTVFQSPLYALEDAAALDYGDFLKDILRQW